MHSFHFCCAVRVSCQKIIRVNVSVAIAKELWSFMRSILTDLTVFYVLNAVL